jgi:hypothetical protein
MSLIQDLADSLRSTRDALPVAEVAGAASRLRTAQSLLAWVMHESAQPAAVPNVAAAANHLDLSAAALRVAQDAIDEYCQALGLPAESRPAAEIPASSVPAQRVTQQDSQTDAQLNDWWSERVGVLSGHCGRGKDEKITSSTELLEACVRSALDGDTKALHDALTGAGPAVGLGLAAVAPPLLRHLATDIVGHPPRLEDLARVRRLALPIIGEVLDKLPSDAPEEIIARVCHAQPERQASQPAHPVDVAAASALLVAGLLRANQRDAEGLAEVLAQQRERDGHAQQRAAERAKSHRAALRITDNVRRRSAVDELRPAAP